MFITLNLIFDFFLEFWWFLIIKNKVKIIELLLMKPLKLNSANVG